MNFKVGKIYRVFDAADRYNMHKYIGSVFRVNEILSSDSIQAFPIAGRKIDGFAKNSKVDSLLAFEEVSSEYPEYFL